MKIIGLTGPIGAGKSTVAKAIMRHPNVIGHGVLFSFADPMKAMFNALADLAEPHNPDPASYAREDKDAKPEWLQGRTVRHALQTLGTEWGRDQISPLFWTKLGMMRAQRSDAKVVVFDDVRFWTEADMIAHHLGGHIFDISRDGAEYPKGHRSEGELAGMFPPIDNNRPADVAAAEIIEGLQIERT